MFNNIWWGFCSEGTIIRNIPSVQTSYVCNKALRGRRWDGGGEMSNLFLTCKPQQRLMRKFSRGNIPPAHCSSLRLPAPSQHSWWGGGEVWQDSVWWWRDHAQLSGLHQVPIHTQQSHMSFQRLLERCRVLQTHRDRHWWLSLVPWPLLSSSGPVKTPFLNPPSSLAQAEQKAELGVFCCLIFEAFLKISCATSGVYTGSAAVVKLLKAENSGSFFTETQE